MKKIPHDDKIDNFEYYIARGSVENNAVLEYCEILAKDRELAEACEAYTRGLKQLAELYAPAMEKTIEMLAEAIGEIAGWLAPALILISETCETILEQYPNKRVIHLAKHGKPRVRKKNIKRILKYFEQESKKRAVFAQN